MHSYDTFSERYLGGQGGAWVKLNLQISYVNYEKKAFSFVEWEVEKEATI